MGAPEPVFIYRARLLKVTDGDTLTLDISLGCHVYITKTVRLLGLDTPEKIGATRVAGLAAAGAARAWCAAAALANADTAWPLVVSTTLDKDDKYGRLLAVVHGKDDPVSLNEALLAGGWAKEYGGGKRA